MNRVSLTLFVACCCFVCISIWNPKSQTSNSVPNSSRQGSAGVSDGDQGASKASPREEVIFWHFWGGADRDVVDSVVARFNASQDQYVVRAVAMPGNNLDVKLFLSITGGQPPDLVNQDDPIVADWAVRDALLSMEEVANALEVEQLKDWLFPSALRLGAVNGELFAVCNGLDIRALYYNKTVLEQAGLKPPQTIAELDHVAFQLSDTLVGKRQVGYLPDSRRLMAWGYVFGGRFYDPVTQQPTLDDPRVSDAMAWMSSYPKRYGAERVAAFRSGDQSLPGKVFPLLPTRDAELRGRYTLIMDGQWRCRDLESFLADRERRGVAAPEFGVLPLPRPHSQPDGTEADSAGNDAGWVNGNFFVVPKGANCPKGAWEFMKFWVGFGGLESEAAQTCIAGGWIPVSPQVVQQAGMQAYLEEHPLFAEFVRLAESPNQLPIPVVPGAAALNREVKAVSEEIMNDPSLNVSETLTQSNESLRRQMERTVER